jgi:hypothetical protein
MQLSPEWFAPKTCDGCGGKSEQSILGKPETYGSGLYGAPKGWQTLRVGDGDYYDKMYFVCSTDCVPVVLDKVRDMLVKRLLDLKEARAIEERLKGED